MNKPELREIPDLPDEVRESGLNGDLVLFVGSGISKLAGLPLWSELAKNILDELLQKNVINYFELNQLSSLNPRKQLSIANLLSPDIPLSSLIKEQCEKANYESAIYGYLNRIGCACVTTNYDELLSPINITISDRQHTPTKVRRIIGAERFYAAYLNVPGTVVHLHGAISEPLTIVATVVHPSDWTHRIRTLS